MHLQKRTIAAKNHQFLSFSFLQFHHLIFIKFLLISNSHAAPTEPALEVTGDSEAVKLFPLSNHFPVDEEVDDPAENQSKRKHSES